ncbi:MAG: lipoate--protein ligase family protein [Salinispira sp.]
MVRIEFVTEMFGSAGTIHNDSGRNFNFQQSRICDPAFNLSTEETLFSRYSPEPDNRETLFIYINNPAVIIGKHQNPWKESDLIWLFEHDIPLFRRISGGGAVFHDTGNILWAFISSRTKFSQESNLTIIQNAAAEYSNLPIDRFSLTARGDILYEGRKISGNALAFRADKVLHHGTLLLNSDLNALGNSLKGLHHFHDLQFSGPAVNSRPAPVAALHSFIPNADNSISPNNISPALLQANFVTSLKKVLIERSHSIRIEDEEEDNEVLFNTIYHRHNSVEWRLRRSPNFNILLKKNLSIGINRGIAHLNSENSDIPHWDITTITGLQAFTDYLRALHLPT